MIVLPHHASREMKVLFRLLILKPRRKNNYSQKDNPHIGFQNLYMLSVYSVAVDKCILVVSVFSSLWINFKLTQTVLVDLQGKCQCI